jgi:glycine/D-amino acid oxidase-like deaminating enzyme
MTRAATPPIGTDESGGGATMTKHAVVIAGGGPTGLMLAGELALAGVDVAVVERRTSQELAMKPRSTRAARRGTRRGMCSR